MTFTSCNFISIDNKQVQELDTIVDFTKVDVSPSFEVCKNQVDKAKTRCFRANMHQQLTKRLRNFSFETKKAINEVIKVIVLIDNLGQVSLQEIQASNDVKNELPELEGLIEKSIDSLPKLYPAIKRGIPVATQYQLPIKIKTK